MDKYTELKGQVKTEIKWLIESIEENHGGYGIPENLTLTDFIGNDFYCGLTHYERGMLFAYLSIKSKIDELEEEPILDNTVIDGTENSGYAINVKDYEEST